MKDIARDEPSYVIITEILYADDTLLCSSDQAYLQILLDAFQLHAKRYGLTLNWEKTKLMTINCEGFLVDGNGGYVKTVDQLVCLGGLLCNDGNHSRDIVRSIGEA
eukprot:6523922-Karenia_brevis.AAC.1